MVTVRIKFINQSYFYWRQKPSSVENVLGHVDLAIQYGEDREVHIPRDLDEPENDGEIQS